MATTTDDYDPATCVTAGELRSYGIVIPESIPDCAWIPSGTMKLEVDRVEGDAANIVTKVTLTARLSEPFRWIEGTFSIEERETPEEPNPNRCRVCGEAHCDCSGYDR